MRRGSGLSPAAGRRTLVRMSRTEDSAAGGFRTLWPTIMVERVLPGHEAANQALAEYIESLDAQHADLTTDYLGGNLMADKHPAVQWLRECVNKTVIDYFRHLGMDYGIDWTMQGWANINRLGDYHDPHNHPHAYLSGTYYVRVPDEKATIGKRSDLRPGCISFYDPRGAVNMGAIRGDPYVDPEHTVRPSGGAILMWPAFLHHFVHPNLSEEPRISISFNVMLKWRDGYVPQQG
jgi:uncharacterized protein (TIGR02466 family)